MTREPQHSPFTPHYIRIRDELVARIESGELALGDRVPSVRELCRDYGVSTITTRRALLDLINQGLVEQRRGVGLFVKRARRTARIALVLTGFTEASWRRNTGSVGQLVGGISSVTWELEATLTVLSLDNVDTAVDALRRLLDDQAMDGVLVRAAGEVDPEMIAMLNDRRVPVVSVKREPIGIAAPSVLADDRLGALLATSHLTSLGHRRIATIVQTSSSASARFLVHGYREALAAAGIPVDDDYVRLVARPLAELAKHETLSLLALPHPPSAIVVGSDFMSLGVYDAAQELGISIPSQLSVTGFDDQDFTARLNPPLTTVHLSYYDLGRSSARLLFDVIAGHRVHTPQVLDVTLVPRESTSPPGTRNVTPR
jgi:LacI family transcriptional regulator